MPRGRSRSRSRSPVPRNRSRSITPVYSSFSGLSLNERQRSARSDEIRQPPRLTRTTRLQRRIPSPVPGQANRSDSFTSTFRRLNFENESSETQPPVAGSRPSGTLRGRRYQQRVMSPRRSTKFWRFTKSGKRKNMSRGSFLRLRRKSIKKRSKSRSRSKRSKVTKRSKKRSIRSRSTRPCLRKSYAPGYRFDGTGINVKTGKRDKFYIWPSKNCRI